MSEIKDLSGTIVIGALFIAGLAFMSNWLLKIKKYFKKFLKFFNDALNLERKQIFVLLAIPALALCYTTGVLLEDTSDYIVGKSSDKTFELRDVMFYFPKEDELKKEVLIRSDFNLTELGKEVCKAHLFSKLGDKNYEEIFEAFENRILSNIYPNLNVMELAYKLWDQIFKGIFLSTFFEEFPKKFLEEFSKKFLEEFRSTSLNIYYYAKNRVYREENYFKELMDIQGRIDFIRSLAWGSFILLFIVTVICSFRFFQCQFEFFKIWPSIIILILIFFLFHIAAIFAYETEEKQFNKRVFGYFLSLNESQKNKMEDRGSTIIF
jgi:hypothetical protein